MLSIQAKRFLASFYTPRYQEGNNVHHFLVIFEKYAEHYGASAPDLPGCVAVGDTLEEVKQAMREAIEMHIQGMIEDNEPIPPHNLRPVI
jgi:predicted RNase H-like HicB family nuclease